MSYTREQRAANAANAAHQANEAAQITPNSGPTPVESIEESNPTAQAPATPEERPQPRQRAEDRIRAMEEVVERQAKHAVPKAPEEAAPTVVETPPPDTTPPPEAVEPVAAAAAPVAAAEPPKTVKQTVDGKEYDVLPSEIEEAGSERAWRIERASKNRLEEAKAANAEAKRLNAELVQQIARQNQPPPVPPATPVQLINAIRAGTEEEATAAVQELINRARGQQVDPQQLVMQSTALSSYNAARRRFAAEFGDLVSNPIIANTLVMEENRRVQQFAQNGQVNWSQVSNVDFDDFFRRMGNEVRSAFGRQSQPPSPPAATSAAPAATSSTPSPPSEREARKASIVNLPTASARAELPPEEKPETREQIIAGMRKSRGLPTG